MLDIAKQREASAMQSISVATAPDAALNENQAVGRGNMQPLAIELMAVTRLRPYARNARTHSKKQIRQIAASIQKFGFTNPVLISDDGEIIAGHGRVEA